mgnify:CR=1 FL=1
MSLHFAKLVFLSPIATGLRAVFAETADNQSVVMPKAHIGQAVAIQKIPLNTKPMKLWKTPFRIILATT